MDVPREREPQRAGGLHAGQTGPTDLWDAGDGCDREPVATASAILAEKRHDVLAHEPATAGGLGVRVVLAVAADDLNRPAQLARASQRRGGRLRAVGERRI